MESPTSRPHQRQRSKSSFSFRSDKSADRKSIGSRPKIDLKEPDGDKNKVRFSAQAIANPNRAMNEDEPASRAQREAATLSHIRSVAWKDAFGNPITDPDASNPSRSRMERPLDTIRSFEAAIYKEEKRKAPPRFEPQESYDSRFNSRRSSMVLNDHPVNGRSPFNRQRSSQYPPDNYSQSQSGFGPRPPAHRYSSAPMPGNGSRLNPDYSSGVYPTQYYRESHETVTTGESYGSNGTEPWGNSTDPSSENSSVDRVHAPNYKVESNDAYGPQYGNQGPVNSRSGSYSSESRHQHSSSPYRNQQYRPDQPSLPEHRVPRKLIRLGSDAGAAGGPPPPPAHSVAAWSGQQPVAQHASQPKSLPKPPVEKRKSWLKRRFSKG